MAFFVGAIGFATPSLTTNTTLVTKSLLSARGPTGSATLAQAFDSLIGGLALAAILPILGVRPAGTLVWVPLLLFLLCVFTLATALFLSCANLFFRDVKYIVQVLLTFGIFLTAGVLLSRDAGPTGSRIIMLNPLSPILEGFRLCIAQGHDLLSPVFGLASDGVPFWPGPFGIWVTRHCGASAACWAARCCSTGWSSYSRSTSEHRMSDNAIEVGTSGEIPSRRVTRQSPRPCAAVTRRIFGRGPRRDGLGEGDFWALRDVSFSVEREGLSPSLARTRRQVDHAQVAYRHPQAHAWPLRGEGPHRGTHRGRWPDSIRTSPDVKTSSFKAPSWG